MKTQIDPKTLIGKMILFLNNGTVHHGFIICDVDKHHFTTMDIGTNIIKLFVRENLIKFLVTKDNKNKDLYHDFGYHLIEGEEYEYFSKTD